MDKLTIRFKVIFFGFIVLGMLSSCVSMKKVRYFQEELEKNESFTTEFKSHQVSEYKIQPGDNLYIKINSLDQEDNEFLNSQIEGRVGGSTYSDMGLYLYSYSVSDSGFVDFPYVGKVFVKDITVEQTKEMLQNILSEYLKDATVIVKMVNYNITLIGEVARPGEYKIYQNRINLFEAISMAGDATRFADRTNVILARKIGDKTKLFHLDLSQRNILASEYYYLQPNDIVYLTPVKGRSFVFAEFPYAIIFSTITTALLILNFFK